MNIASLSDGPKYSELSENGLHAGVAGDTDEARLVALAHPAKQSGDTRRDLGFGLGSVRQACKIGCIDYGRVREQPVELCKHAQPTNAAVKHKDGGGWVQNGVLPSTGACPCAVLTFTATSNETGSS